MICGKPHLNCKEGVVEEMVQKSLQTLIENILEYWLLICVLSTTICMAVMRTAKAHGKVDWLEAGMCGLFSFGVWFALSWLNIPEGVGVVIGGFIGYKGTVSTSQWVSKKLDLEDFKKEENKDE